MNSKIDYSDFFSTKSEAIDFKTRLENVIDKIYLANFNLEKILGEEFGIQEKDKLIEIFHENKDKNIKEFIEKIIKDIEALPTLNITLAFEPNDKVLVALSQWFLTSLNRQVIFDIQVDKKIIAGAMINFNGKYKDYSVKPLLNSIINQKLSQRLATVAPSSPIHQNTEHMTIGR